MTTVKGDRYIPMLVQYVSDHDRFRATIILQTTGFPTVEAIFQQVMPTNQCVWQNECTLDVPAITGEVTYSFEQRVPVYEGIFVLLTEFSRDTEGTCDSFADSSMQSDRTSITSQGPEYESDELHGSARTLDVESDAHSFMQLDLDSPTALRDLHMYVAESGGLDGIDEAASH